MGSRPSGNSASHCSRMGWMLKCCMGGMLAANVASNLLSAHFGYQAILDLSADTPCMQTRKSDTDAFQLPVHSQA